MVVSFPAAAVSPQASPIKPSLLQSGGATATPLSVMQLSSAGHQSIFPPSSEAARQHQALRRKLSCFYKQHPRYAQFAHHHPLLNKWILVAGTAAAILAPTTLIRAGVGRMIRLMRWWPIPQTYIQTAGAVGGITLGFAGLGWVVNRTTSPDAPNSPLNSLDPTKPKSPTPSTSANSLLSELLPVPAKP